ncbi:hypothetical protein [uncultured Clostridium sp.]|nr:hypothetical protein [uncultured Clostridium sp.]
MNSDNSEEIKARKNKMNRSNRDIYIAGLEYLELANKMKWRNRNDRARCK